MTPEQKAELVKEFEQKNPARTEFPNPTASSFYDIARAAELLSALPVPEDE